MKKKIMNRFINLIALSLLLCLSLTCVACGSKKSSSSQSYSGIQPSLSTKAEDDTDEIADMEETVDLAEAEGIDEAIDSEETIDSGETNESSVSDVSVPDDSKLHFTINGRELVVPGTVESWEEAGMSVRYDWNPDTNMGNGRAFDPMYPNFYIDIMVRVVNGPYGDDLRVVSAKLEPLAVLLRDVNTVPEVPEMTFFDGEFKLFDVYDFASLPDLYGDEWTIYSYFRSNEDGYTLGTKWSQGNGWEPVTDFDISNVWFTSYHYNGNGIEYVFSTMDTNDYELGLEVNQLASFEINFNKFWE